MSSRPVVFQTLTPSPIVKLEAPHWGLPSIPSRHRYIVEPKGA